MSKVQPYCGINMIKRLWEWNEQREKEGKPPLDMGLGLNTDKIVAGNIGSQKRMDYTMIGDGVNLAARLESACKQYNARILISDFTYQFRYWRAIMASRNGIIFRTSVRVCLT